MYNHVVYSVFCLEPVIIFSLPENIFILPYTAVNYARIGMNDIAEEGVFVWEDGSPVTHQRWAPSNPNGGTGENCVSISKTEGGFADLPCNEWGVFAICETDYNVLFP